MKHAFTLAEVLITLGVIGIVAAMTLPGLIAKYEKKVLANQAKVFYSQFSQAYNAAIAKHGDPGSWTQSKYQSATMADERMKLIFNEMKGQTCYVAYGADGWIGSDNKKSQPCKTVERYVKSLNPNTSGFTSYFISNYGSGIRNEIILPSGAIVSANAHVDSNTSTSDYAVSGLWVDVNGLKKPNQIGKDIHFFVVVYRYGKISSGSCFGHNMEYTVCLDKSRNFKSASAIYPSGYNYNIWSTSVCTAKNPRDERCTAKLVRDGWEFKDDYPW